MWMFGNATLAQIRMQDRKRITREDFVCMRRKPHLTIAVTLYPSYCIENWCEFMWEATLLRDCADDEIMVETSAGLLVTLHFWSGQRSPVRALKQGLLATTIKVGGKYIMYASCLFDQANIKKYYTIDFRCLCCIGSVIIRETESRARCDDILSSHLDLFYKNFPSLLHYITFHAG